MRTAPLVMHVVYRFGVGGLENGVVNLINRLPREQFRHAVVALTAYDERFARRIERDDVELIALGKGPGHGYRVWRAAWRLFKQYRPDIVHTRNLAALEMQFPAWLASVPVRLHGEHGRDVFDPDGSNRRHRIARRIYSPFVTRYVAVSRDLQQYLRDDVGVNAGKVTCICNGVDERRFAPVGTAIAGVSGEVAPSSNPVEDQPMVVGCVGRLQTIKGHAVLLQAVALLLARAPHWRRSIRVQLVGGGPLRATLESQAAEAGIGDVVEFLGERHDVAERMRRFDVFVLPSLAEGISNTVLESMASGVPVVATSVGGNAELVTDGETGFLVPPNDAARLADALERYLSSPELRGRHGQNARAAVELRFTLEGMIDRYRTLYVDALERAGVAAANGRGYREDPQ